MAEPNGVELVSYSQFASNPELQKEYGGSYANYIKACTTLLQKTPLFTFGNTFGKTMNFSTKPFIGNDITLFGSNRQQNTLGANNSLEKMLEGVDDKTKEFILKSMASGNPTRAFIDELIKRYEKRHEEFEAVWEQYQASKNQTQLYKRVCEIVTKKYEDSESNYELGLITASEKNYTDSEMNTGILLSKARDISHRATV